MPPESSPSGSLPLEPLSATRPQGSLLLAQRQGEGKGDDEGQDNAAPVHVLNHEDEDARGRGLVLTRCLPSCSREGWRIKATSRGPHIFTHASTTLR